MGRILINKFEYFLLVPGELKRGFVFINKHLRVCKYRVSRETLVTVDHTSLISSQVTFAPFCVCVCVCVCTYICIYIHEGESNENLKYFFK